MSLHLDTRQRAMLQEMGVHVWSPRPAPVTAAPVATDTAASTASSAATRTAAPTPVPTPARTPRPAPSAPTTTSAAPAAPAHAALTWTLQAPQPLYPNAPPATSATSADSRHTAPRWLLLAEGSTGADPLAERLRLCSHEPSKRVLQAVGEMSGWNTPLAPSRDGGKRVAQLRVARRLCVGELRSGSAGGDDDE